MKLKSALSHLCISFGVLTVLPLRADDPVFEEIGFIKSQFEPLGNMVNPGDGYFYGAARWSEFAAGGLIFRIAPGQEAEILHTFGVIENGGETNVGGSNPDCPLVLGADGAFYGVTSDAGAYGFGTIYRITSDGTYSVLHDMATPIAAVFSLIATPQGELYGAGADFGPLGGGTIFKVGADGIFETIHAFEESPIIPPTDTVPPGTRFPFHSPYKLALGPDGNIYGSVSQGGLVHASNPFRFSYGGLFRYDSPNTVTMLSEYVPNTEPNGSNAVLGVPGADGFYGTYNHKLIRTNLNGSVDVLADLTSMGVTPGVSLIMPDGIYGTASTGGEDDAGFIYRYVAGEGATIIHHFGEEYARRIRSLVAGNDGFVYGIAAFPENYRPEEPEVTPPVAAAAVGKAKAKAKKKKVVVPRPITFRFKAGASASNFVPVAKPDASWLPAKATGGKREVLVDVLANDRDPDGDALSIAGLGELSEGTAEVVTTPKGTRVRFETTEADPASQVLTYDLSDGNGGTSTGSISLKSPATGSFTGSASSEGAAAAPLTVTFGKKNTITATLVVAGKKYTGKGVLDVADSADLALKAKKQPSINLHLGLHRGATREIDATFLVGDAVYTATLLPKTKK